MVSWEVNMKWIAGFVLAAALLLPVQNQAAFNKFQLGYSSTPQITCNLVTGVASIGGPCTSTTTCNGSGDDAPAFLAFNTWARANQGSNNQVVLTLPNGSNCIFNSNQSYSGAAVGNTIASGIKNLIVEATGATMTAGTSGYNLGTGVVICHRGLTDASGCSARIQSVSAGATQVTLTSASLSAGYISRFSVGQWLLFGGVDIQGIWNSPFGYPPNNHFFEWHKITNVNAGTGVIMFDGALSNSYLSTWPSYNSGNAFEADPGGPATIWAINSNWDATLEYRGLTSAQTAAQSYAEGRNIIFRNATFTGCCGLVPSQNETFSAYNTVWNTNASPGWEVDKFIGTVTLDTVTIPRVDFQSSSTNLLVMRNSTIGSQFGTPKNSQITDTSWSGTFRPGAWTNGESTGSLVCTRCSVATFDFDGGIFQNRPTDYSMSSGVISFANTNASGSDPDQRVFVPNGNIFWTASGYVSTGLFQSQALTQDPTNVFIQTNEAGGFPTIGTNIPQFRTHPAPQFTCDACTGDATLVATNIQNGATALAPLGQYGFRSYAPSAGTAAAGSIKSKGKLVSLTINVTQAYTGTGTVNLNATGQFHNFNADQSGWVQYDWVPQINLKQAGIRVITPSGTTCNGSAGACAGDVCVQPASGCFTPPSTIWISSGIDPYINGTFSGGVNPQFTITIVTNQGVVP
jgi:hypothetical protein